MSVSSQPLRPPGSTSDHSSREETQAPINTIISCPPKGYPRDRNGVPLRLFSRVRAYQGSNYARLYIVIGFFQYSFLPDMHVVVVPENGSQSTVELAKLFTFSKKMSLHEALLHSNLEVRQTAAKIAKEQSNG